MYESLRDAAAGTGKIRLGNDFRMTAIAESHLERAALTLRPHRDKDGTEVDIGIEQGAQVLVGARFGGGSFRRLAWRHWKK